MQVKVAGYNSKLKRYPHSYQPSQRSFSRIRPINVSDCVHFINFVESRASLETLNAIQQAVHVRYTRLDHLQLEILLMTTLLTLALQPQPKQL